MAGKDLITKIEQGRQYRTMKMFVKKADDESLVDNEKIVEGYATTFNSPYTLWEDKDFIFNEQVDAKAFDGCDLSDVIMQYDHVGKVYARTSNGTLELVTDEHGLKIRANLGGTEDGRKLYEEIKGGYTNKMSFVFIVTDEAEEKITDEESGKDVYLRTIKKIGKLFDVSAVSLPANDGTEISARSLVDGVIAKRMAEKAKINADEERKQKDFEKVQKERERLALEMELSFMLNNK